MENEVVLDSMRHRQRMFRHTNHAKGESPGLGPGLETVLARGDKL